MRTSTILLLLAALAACYSIAEAVSADANHILVADEAKCNDLKAQIDGAADAFAKVGGNLPLWRLVLAICICTPCNARSRFCMLTVTCFLSCSLASWPRSTGDRPSLSLPDSSVPQSKGIGILPRALPIPSPLGDVIWLLGSGRVAFLRMRLCDSSRAVVPT